MSENTNKYDGPDKEKFKEKRDLKVCKCGFSNSDSVKICTQCGRQLSPDDAYCAMCGNKIVNISSFEHTKEDYGSQYGVKQLVSKVDTVRSELAIKILSVISIICFFMTFVKESVMGFGISLNGIEAAFGIALGSGTEAIVVSEDSIVNVFVLLSLIFSIVVLINAFTNSPKSVLGMSITSAGCLLMYMCTYNAYYGYDELEAFMSIEFGFAVWGVLIINVVLSVLAWSMVVKTQSAHETGGERFSVN